MFLTWLDYQDELSILISPLPHCFGQRIGYVLICSWHHSSGSFISPTLIIGNALPCFEFVKISDFYFSVFSYLFSVCFGLSCLLPTIIVPWYICLTWCLIFASQIIDTLSCFMMCSTVYPCALINIWPIKYCRIHCPSLHAHLPSGSNSQFFFFEKLKIALFPTLS